MLKMRQIFLPTDCFLSGEKSHRHIKLPFCSRAQGCKQNKLSIQKPHTSIFSLHAAAAAATAAAFALCK
jgi:hypothetical protein